MPIKKKGRPTKYKPGYCQRLTEFFSIEPCRTTTERFYYKNGDEKEKEIEVANNLPFFSGFARQIKVNTDTLNEWTKKHKEELMIFLAFFIPVALMLVGIILI